MNGNIMPVLGKNLRNARKKQYPNDTQEDFALRIGASRATLQRMEKGDMGVAFARYFAAAKLLDLDDPFYTLFRPDTSHNTTRGKNDFMF